MRCIIKNLYDAEAATFCEYLEDLNKRKDAEIGYILSIVGADVSNVEFYCSDFTFEFHNAEWVEFRYDGRNDEYYSIYFDQFEEISFR